MKTLRSSVIGKAAVFAAAMALAIFVTESADADHNYYRHTQTRCNPVAEAHMNAALKLMRIAYDKPPHVARSLANVAAQKLARAASFANSPHARADLYTAIDSLKGISVGHCGPAFDVAIHQTRHALEVEKGLCLSSFPRYRNDRQSFGYEPHRSPGPSTRAVPREVYRRPAAEVAGRWGQVWFGF